MSIDDLSYSVIKDYGNVLYVRSRGYYEGKWVVQLSWVSKELLEDDAVLMEFFERTMEDWARDNLEGMA